MNAPAPSSALLPDTAGLVLRPVVSGDIERERAMQTIGLIEAEMAAVVTDAWHRQGVGRQLVQQAIAAAGAQGIAILHGDILTGNIAGIALARSLGFTIAPHPDGASLRLASLDLRSQGTPRHPV